jgi:hypothetical protein
MLSETNYRILPNGKCSECGTPMVSVEDGEIVVKSRVEKIDPSTGKIKYKCRNSECKKWLSVEHFRIVFNASLPLYQAR